MAENNSIDLTARARIELGLNDSVPVRGWAVRRLDQPGKAYYLAVFGEEDQAVAAAVVDLRDGIVEITAELTGSTQLGVDESCALELAGLGAGSTAELVWRPCRASYSPLYPIWEVRKGSDVTYVDQHGRIWSMLVPSGPGG